MNHAFRVQLASHGFRVDLIVSGHARRAIMEFLMARRQFELVRVGRGRFERKPKRTFAASDNSRSYFRLHIGEWDKFQEHMSEFGFTPDYEGRSGQARYQVIAARQYEPRKVSLPLAPGWAPRNQLQHNAHAYLMSPERKPWGNLIPMQPGAGKGFVAMNACSERGEFVIYILRPKYKDKWINEIATTYAIAEEDIKDKIPYVEGAAQLRKICKLQAQGKFDAPVLIISNMTFLSWIKSYESIGERKFHRDYHCTPENFYEFMQAGVRIIDEGHQDFHFNYKQDCYANVPFSITLTATLITRDPFLKGRYEVAYPKRMQFDAGELNRYIDASSYLYRFSEPELISVSERGDTKYSPNAFEVSIMRQPSVLKNYLEMLGDLVEIDFYRIRDPGEKFIMFFYRVDMCILACRYLKERFKDDIRTYTGENIELGHPKDPYENLIDPVGRVSTYGSAGTAQDIPMLRTTITALAMESVSGNIQTLGRLRVMASGNTPRYVNVMALNIDKHVGYQKLLAELMGERARTYRIRHHDKNI